MKNILFLFIASFAALPLFAQDASVKSSDETTYIFIRHAEKMDDGTSNPDLSAEGIERAEGWIDLLEEYEISAIYSTPYNRTQQTAAPIANHLELDVQEYGFSNIDSLVTRFKELYKNTAVLIVGHSNTTPLLVNVMIQKEEYPNLEESDYETYFMVVIDEEGKAVSKKLRYQGRE